MWQLIRGDALEALRELEAASVDAVITDPPYSSGGLTPAERRMDPVTKYIRNDVQREYKSFSGDNRDQRSWVFWSVLWASQAARALKPGGRFYMFTDWRQFPAATDIVQAAGLVWRGVVVWDKGRGARAPHTGYHRHQTEYILFATKGKCDKVQGGPFDGVIRASYPADKLHPTQKPEAVIAELVRAVPEGGVILDPFAGSGTTLAVAEKMGRHAVGIECVDEYADLIEWRMERLELTELELARVWRAEHAEAAAATV